MNINVNYGIELYKYSKKLNLDSISVYVYYICAFLSAYCYYGTFLIRNFCTLWTTFYSTHLIHVIVKI